MKSFVNFKVLWTKLLTLILIILSSSVITNLNSLDIFNKHSIKSTMVLDYFYG